MRPLPLEPRRTDASVDVVALFRVLAARHEDMFWLDAGAGATEGWSVLGVGELDPRGPADVRLDVTSTAVADGPPFRGGWVGWLDYETGAASAGAPAAHSEGGPAWLGVTAAVAINHSTGAAWELGGGLSPLLGSLLGPLSERSETERVGAQRRETSKVAASARHTPAEYTALIERCRDAIRAGTAYQLCLTTRFQVDGRHDDVETYLRLRTATPAHHGGFVRVGGRALLSASPETFLHASGGRIRTRPIKGTRPRGADPASDAALAAELLASDKERAENVMIVDLMRNDLSRVCMPGSIRVDGLWEVESYPAVHQLVSTVSGRPVDGLTVRRLWDAAFPAGSMTGAPKLSAMTLLHELEGGAPRGVYSGCFGYVGVDGAMDLAMVIRSILIADDHAVVGAGGGITWGSAAADEVEEVATKARAPLAALGAGLPDAWRS
ncbi:anthranilate synthase component I family protein [Microbacterium sp. TWP3-1-2b2]|uniref:anthranilate synthase component I family protein n=1 Tax=Microbacterium sp. TWP3-1-2b2 TaxID=2804651 RepID=UPI003CFBC2BC